MMRRTNTHIELDNQRIERLHASLSYITTPTLLTDRAVWKVYREQTLLLGGLRAVLMQISHPAVAAGVGEYSQFRMQTLKRLKNTLLSMYDIIFGTPEVAKARTKKMFRIHNQVFGIVQDDSNSKWSGKEYRANDPFLLHWVSISTAETALTMYEEFVGCLTPEEEAVFVQEYNVIANLMGIDESFKCHHINDIRNFYPDQINKGNVFVTPTAQKIHKDLVSLTGKHQAITSLLAAKHLPEEIRQQYGLSWNKSDQSKFAISKERILLVRNFVPYAKPYRKAKALLQD